MLRASSIRLAPAAHSLRAPSRTLATVFDEREAAFEGKWAREEQRKALDNLKASLKVKRTPIDEELETKRLAAILDKAGFAAGADRDALKVRLLLWKHDEVRAAPRPVPL